MQLLVIKFKDIEVHYFTRYALQIFTYCMNLVAISTLEICNIQEANLMLEAYN